MTRSFKVRRECLEQIKLAVSLNGFARQQDLTLKLELEGGPSRSTVSNFFTGKAVSYEAFVKICQKLGLQWKEIADLRVKPNPSPEQVEAINAKDLNWKHARNSDQWLLNEPTTLPNSPLIEEDPEGSPLQVVPELPVGQVDLASAFYVKRPPIESQCYNTILEPGALIRIKAPRLMGKTSLMARILDEARKQGYQTIPLSLQSADRAVFTNLDTFLRWFCESVGRKLKRLNQLDDYWNTYGSKDKTTIYFEECLLEEITSPLVVSLDEVDRLFPYREIADDFFSLLRAWYEHAKYGDSSSKLWKKLRVVLVHCKEVYIPMDINQSPFNVGLSVELQEFNQEQIQSLVECHDRLNWTTAQVERLMSMVGGHPYLVRLALYHIQHQNITLEQLLKTAPTEAGIYSDHLRRHLGNLKQYPVLLAAFKQVVTASAPVKLDMESTFKLHSMGLVVHQHENKVTPRCNLYRQYFRQRLS